MNDHYGNDDDYDDVGLNILRCRADILWISSIATYDQNDDVQRWFHFTDVAVFHIKVLMCVKAYLSLYIY